MCLDNPEGERKQFGKVETLMSYTATVCWLRPFHLLTIAVIHGHWRRLIYSSWPLHTQWFIHTSQLTGYLSLLVYWRWCATGRRPSPGTGWPARCCGRCHAGSALSVVGTPANQEENTLNIKYLLHLSMENTLRKTGGNENCEESNGHAAQIAFSLAAYKSDP